MPFILGLGKTRPHTNFLWAAKANRPPLVGKGRIIVSLYQIRVTLVVMYRLVLRIAKILAPTFLSSYVNRYNGSGYKVPGQLGLRTFLDS